MFIKGNFISYFLYYIILIFYFYFSFIYCFGQHFIYINIDISSIIIGLYSELGSSQEKVCLVGFYVSGPFIRDCHNPGKAVS